MLTASDGRTRTPKNMIVHEGEIALETLEIREAEDHRKRRDATQNERYRI